MISQKKILVVEDNEINRAMLSEILSSEYQVLEAENGAVALDVLKEYGEGISLILLDIIMPVMDGYTFLAHVKADQAYSSIPVIVTTQSDGESDEVAALSHGAADFVAKPYRPQIILHRVASIINLRETAAVINMIQYDRLTGLYSKEFFYQRVKEILLQHPDRKYDILCSDIENFKLINDIFGIPAGDRLLCGVADMYTRLVGDKGICGRFNADQFACLLEHTAEYTDDMFIELGMEINSLSHAKNIVMKWGFIPYTTGGFPWSRCATGPCWRPTASRGSMANTVLPMTISCGAGSCGSRPSRTVWRRRWRRASLRYICSPSTGLRMTGWPEQKRLYAGTIRNGECSPLRILFLYLKRTVLSPSWINMSGTGPAQC